MSRFAWIATVGFIFAIVFAFAVWTFKGEPRTVVHIKAESRSVEFVVSNETTARIGLPAPLLQRGSNGDSTCVRGSIAPASGVRVRYSSAAQNVLVISLEAQDRGSAGRFLSQSGETSELEPTAMFAYGEAAGCGSTSAVALPIWGEAAIGETPRVDGSGSDGLGPVLLSGEVDVFGVSRFQSEGRATIYPVQTFPLPAGATIRGLGRGDAEPVLRGAAFYRPNNDLGALTVSVTSEAGLVQIIRWGSTNGGEIVDIGPLAQVSGDPALASAAALFALILLSLSAVSAILQVYGEAR